MKKLIKHSNKGNLLHNEETGYYEIYSDGRRLQEILVTDEDSAIEVFKMLVGEVWNPDGEQGSKGDDR